MGNLEDFPLSCEEHQNIPGIANMRMSPTVDVLEAIDRVRVEAVSIWDMTAEEVTRLVRLNSAG